MTMQACGFGGLLLSGSHHAQLHNLGTAPLIGGLASSVTCLHMMTEPMGGVAMSSGIYQIENQVNGKRYIGSSVNIESRWSVHLALLRHGKHDNQHLQRAFDKYGESAFAFTILEDVEEFSQLIECEQHYLDTSSPEYNIAPTAGSSIGVRHNEETRRKMSEAKCGERNPFFGKHHSAELLRKLHEGRRGRHHSDESKQKMSAATSGEQHHYYGKHLSEEHKRKISKALKARWTQGSERHHMYGTHLSEEIRQKISDALKGKQANAETRKRMREAQKGKRNNFYGKRHSVATRQKISASLKAYWAQKRKERGDVP